MPEAAPSPGTGGSQAVLDFLPLQVIVGLNPGPATSRLCDLGQLSALLSAHGEIRNQKMLGKVSTSLLRCFCVFYDDKRKIIFMKGIIRRS